MKKASLLSALAGLALLFVSGCATTPVYERNFETRMIVIQEKIDDGAATDALAPDQSRMYLATLKDIRAEYAQMSGKKVSRAQRDELRGRFDALEQVVDKALAPPPKPGKLKESFWVRIGRDLGILAKTEKNRPPTNGEMIIRVQKRIDDGRNSGEISLHMAEEFQTRLDYIRNSYLRMMEGSRTPTIEEREVISRLLYTLDGDLNVVPRI